MRGDFRMNKKLLSILGVISGLGIGSIVSFASISDMYRTMLQTTLAGTFLLIFLGLGFFLFCVGICIWIATTFTDVKKTKAINIGIIACILSGVLFSGLGIFGCVDLYEKTIQMIPEDPKIEQRISL